jgi:hypothetical protein
MKISKIKSFVFGLAFLGSMGFGVGTVNAQQEESPCPDGTSNSYGGVCCQSSRDCIHPWAGQIEDSSWTSCIAVCS